MKDHQEASMSAPRVLLIGKRNEEVVGIKHMLAKNTGYDVELVSVAQKAVQRLTSQTVDLCVFNFDLFTRDKIKLATDLRSLGYEFPVLVLSRIIATDAYEAIRNMHHTILLEKPFEHKDLWGLSDKLISGRSVAQRTHRRFYTNQKAAIATFDGGTSAANGKLFNLSRGGAYLEFGEGSSQVKQGDMLQLNVQLNEVYRQYNVSARVVWTTTEGLWGTGRGIGVEFVKAKDVYRDLLHKI